VIPSEVVGPDHGSNPSCVIRERVLAEHRHISGNDSELAEISRQPVNQKQ
jgi:hypothetical protein